jgi:hypothetical protein
MDARAYARSSLRPSMTDIEFTSRRPRRSLSENPGIHPLYILQMDSGFTLVPRFARNDEIHNLTSVFLGASLSENPRIHPLYVRQMDSGSTLVPRFARNDEIQVG